MTINANPNAYPGSNCYTNNFKAGKQAAERGEPCSPYHIGFWFSYEAGAWLDGYQSVKPEAHFEDKR